MHAHLGAKSSSRCSPLEIIYSLNTLPHDCREHKAELAKRCKDDSNGDETLASTGLLARVRVCLCVRVLVSDEVRNDV